MSFGSYLQKRDREISGTRCNYYIWIIHTVCTLLWFGFDQWQFYVHICHGCFTRTGTLDHTLAPVHYGDVIMGTVASQITGLTIVYSTIWSDAAQRKHQSSALLAFVRGIHRWPVNSPHKWPVTRKMFPFDDIIMKVNQPLLILSNESPEIIYWQNRLHNKPWCIFYGIFCNWHHWMRYEVNSITTN